MLDKIKIREIITDHINTLKNDNTGKYRPLDIFLFLIFPFLMGSALIILGFDLSEDFSDGLLTVMAILTGFLFNLFLLAYDLLKNEKPKKTNQDKARELLEQTHSNISFSILSSLTTVILLLVAKIDCNSTIHAILETFSVSITILVILTLLMILKRVYNLFKNDIRRNQT